MKSHRIGHILFILCVSILSLICIAFIANGFIELQYSLSPGTHYSEDNYTSTLKYQEYSHLYYLTVNDSADPEKLSSSILACQAVARYYEAAIIYKACVDNNNSAAAEKQLQRMKTYASQCEIYQEHLTNIRSLLKLSTEEI